MGLRDSTSISVERSCEVAAAGGLQGVIDQVLLAEEALAEGRYGTCQACGGTVGDARLEAVPEATCCVGCA
ncbi:MAG: hypothetical protein NVS3B26_24310 [Mycobacteriales bacterium]